MESCIRLFLTGVLHIRNGSKLFIIDGENKEIEILTPPYLWKEIEWVLTRLVFLFPFIRERSQTERIRIVNI